ncbi:MAG: hypothetical protein UT50_C0015G0008 [Candidatus Moranbacteria bacterium GW2011_GWA2_39_41]|nr:MAG: hypothetical protein UT50_C0015G0008 [Candidatus Moranbacteria bacterium GW2011_GWA2_39_41]
MNNDRPIVQLLEENELNISQLYALYAQKIPAKQAFWEQISQEEIAHAAAFKNDTADIDLTQSIEETKFSRGIVQYVMDFVLQEVERAQKDPISHFDALQTALRIERSMLEKKCFDIFTPTNTTIKELFQRMNTDTEKHIDILMKELKKQ